MAQKKQNKNSAKKKEVPAATPNPQNTLPQGSSKFQKWIYLAVVLILTFIAFRPVLNKDFIVMDTHKLLLKNPVVKGEVPVSEAFNYYLYTPHFKPLVLLSWRMEHAYFGFDPYIYHLNNLLLHLGNAVLVFFVFMLMAARFKFLKEHKWEVGFLMALLFALHPMRVESVAWAVERKDVLYSFFFLGSVLSYLSYLEGKLKQKWLIAVSAILFLLSLMAKAPAIVLPVLFLFFDWVFGRNLKSKDVWIEKAPMFVVLIVAFYLYGLFGNFSKYSEGLVGGVAGDEVSELSPNLVGLPSFYQRILILNFKLWFYLLHIIFPFKLSIYYPRPLFIGALGNAIHALPVLTLSAFYLIYRFWRKRRFALLGLGFFLITLLPALSIADKGTGVFVSDRYSYIPSLGCYFFLISGFYYLLAKRSIQHKLSFAPWVLLAFFFAFLTYGRAETWHNDETLWTDCIEKYDLPYPCYRNRAKFYYDNKMYEKAVDDYIDLLPIVRKKGSVHRDLGSAYLNLKKWDKAIENYAKAREYHPEDFSLAFFLGHAYDNAGKTKEAIQYYGEALQLPVTAADKPYYYDCVYRRAQALRRAKRYDEAFQDYQKAIAHDPQRPLAYFGLGNHFYTLKDYTNAIKYYQKTLELNPKHRFATTSLAAVYQNQNNLDKALELYEAGFKINNKNGLAYRNRSIIYKNKRQYKLALQDAEKAKSLGAQVTDAYLNELKALAR